MLSLHLQSSRVRLVCTLNGDGEVASAAVSFGVSGCVLDQSLPHWELSALLMATGYCEETA